MVQGTCGSVGGYDCKDPNSGTAITFPTALTDFTPDTLFLISVDSVNVYRLSVDAATILSISVSGLEWKTVSLFTSRARATESRIGTATAAANETATIMLAAEAGLYYVSVTGYGDYENRDSQQFSLEVSCGKQCVNALKRFLLKRVRGQLKCVGVYLANAENCFI